MFRLTNKYWVLQEKVSLFIKAGIFYSVIFGIAFCINYVLIPLADSLIGHKLDILGIVAPYRPILRVISIVFAILAVLTFLMCGVLLLLKYTNRKKKGV